LSFKLQAVVIDFKSKTYISVSLSIWEAMLDQYVESIEFILQVNVYVMCPFSTYQVIERRYSVKDNGFPLTREFVFLTEVLLRSCLIGVLCKQDLKDGKNIKMTERDVLRKAGHLLTLRYYIVLLYPCFVLNDVMSKLYDFCRL